MKPDTVTAMQQLIAEIRRRIPLDALAVEVCADSCDGCSLKLLEYLKTEVENWEWRLAQGDAPRFGDLDRLARSARKIHAALSKNGLLAD
jgi:hypothetical protein